MHIVEVFLPLETGDGTPIGTGIIEGIIGALAERFGGATAFTRAPAEGLWKQNHTIQKDRIIIVEVMVDAVDNAWWKDFRSGLEKDLQQEVVVIRVTPCRLI